MLNPILFRRLLFLADYLFFGAFFALHGLLAAGALGLSFACTFATRYVEKRYELTEEPLFPSLRAAARLRLLRTKLPAPPQGKGTRVLLFGLVALVVFFSLPAALRSTIMPTAGGFTPDNLGAYTLGAFQFFAALSMAFAAWRGLFPSFYAYAVETMEANVLASITTDLLARLPAEFLAGQEDLIRLRLTALAERRKIATLTFSVRCVRTAFSVLPFFVFFFAANAALASALTVVPAAVLGQ